MGGNNVTGVAHDGERVWFTDSQKVKITAETAGVVEYADLEETFRRGYEVTAGTKVATITPDGGEAQEVIASIDGFLNFKPKHGDTVERYDEVAAISQAAISWFADTGVYTAESCDNDLDYSSEQQVQAAEDHNACPNPDNARCINRIVVPGVDYLNHIIVDHHTQHLWFTAFVPGVIGARSIIGRFPGTFSFTSIL